MKDATPHCSWPVSRVLGALCILCSALSPPLSSPSTVPDVTPGLCQRQASQLLQRQGSGCTAGCRLSVSWGLCLKFLVSVPLLMNSSVLHQKPLKSLANRMATDWNKCLVIFYVHCYIHVCMCVCVLECRGFRKKFSQLTKQMMTWEEFSMPEQQTPSPSPKECWEWSWSWGYETIPIPCSKTYLWYNLKLNDYVILFWHDSYHLLSYSIEHGIVALISG